jgi:hypothetical protein
MTDFSLEFELLLSMYPEEVTFDKRCSELSYKHPSGRLCLRIPPKYPLHAAPEVLSATGPSKQDVRDAVVGSIQRQQPGDSCLDAVIADFSALIAALEFEEHETSKQQHALEEQTRLATNKSVKTVVIWLHHLLATSKRKQALSPAGSDSTYVTGFTKPGYPGVLVFSGPTVAVDAHVQALKHQRWQAFQLRYEADVTWRFKHGNGIIEVETMGEAVAELENNVGAKETFMEALKMK